MIRPSSIESAIRTILLVAGDLLLGLGALAAAVYIRHNIPLSFTRSLLPAANFRFDGINVLLFCTAFICALGISGFYRRRVMPTEKPVMATLLLIQVALIAIGSDAIERPLPRTILLFVVVIEALALPAWRFLLTAALPIRARETILVGEAEHVRSAITALELADDRRVRVIGWTGPAEEPLGVPWIGALDADDVRSQLRDVEEVIYASPEISAATRLDLLRIRGPRGYVLLASPADALISSSTLGWLGDQPLIEIAVGCGYGTRAVIKRLADLTIGLVALIVISPLMILAAIAVWLDDGRPILIRQLRVGRNGVPFGMWKFRSMRLHSATSLDKDHVTMVGWFLRRYRIDELPQLINVLAGEMSLVGPRPERPDIAAEIASDLPEFDLRCLVRPGIAGLAQISAKYDSKPDVKLRYDLSYMCGWSLLLDLRLLLASVSASLAGSGR